MDLEKVLSRLRRAPGYIENANHIRSVVDRSEARDSLELRAVADEIMKSRTKDGFDPDEPRDEHGEWTSGGGEASVRRRDALLDYVVSESNKQTVTKKLRTGGKLTSEEQKFVNDLQSAIDHNKLTDETVLYRGTSSDQNSAKSVEGSFISTTKDPSVASQFGKVIWEIHAPAGTPALDIAKVLPHQSDEETQSAIEDEQEVLLGMKTKLKFLGEDKGHKVFEVE